MIFASKTLSLVCLRILNTKHGFRRGNLHNANHFIQLEVKVNKITHNKNKRINIVIIHNIGNALESKLITLVSHPGLTVYLTGENLITGV